jgi:hypothetical protein
MQEDKDRYAVDGSNRLVIKLEGKRLAAGGRFEVGKGNRLTYWLNEPVTWRQKYNLPDKVTFEGNWRLNTNHDLELHLGRIGGDYLTLKGEIISTDRDSLVFEIKSLDRQGLLHAQLIKLSGAWCADKYNRISFLVEKKTFPDTLTLQGDWQINKNQQIVYTYEKIELKTRIRTSHAFIFEGFWQITDKDRLTYILARSSDSRFDFRVQLESPNLYPREGVIKYRIGIGLKEKEVSHQKIISLYGAWKFSRKAGLAFQMEYGNAKIQDIEFRTEINLSKKDEIVFALTDKRNKPLGISVTFTHRFLKKLDAETFVRLKKVREESGIEAGVRIPF